MGASTDTRLNSSTVHCFDIISGRDFDELE